MFTPRRTILSIGLFLFIAACFILTPFLSEAASSGKVSTWYYQRSSSGKPNTGNPGVDSQMTLIDIIQKASDGRIKVVLQENLVKQPVLLDAVRKRTLEVAIMGTQIRAELVPLAFATLPVIPREKIPVILKKMKPRFQEFIEKEYGVILLGFSFYSPQALLTSKPVNTVEDMRKLKMVRTSGYEVMKFLTAAGVPTVTLRFGEVYTSLQRGMIEGVVSGVDAMMRMGWHEVTKYVSTWPVGDIYSGVFMNKDAFSELGPDGQKKLMIAMEEFDRANFEGANKMDEIAQAMAQKAGITVINPTQAEKDKLLAYSGTVIEEWKKRSGPLGAEVMSAINEVLGTNY